MKIDKLSGFLIFLSLFFTIYAYFINENILVFAGIFAWIAFVFLFKTIHKSLILKILISLTVVLFIFSLLSDFEVDFTKAILVNQHLLTLLIAVGFLRLIATPKQKRIRKLPIGKNAFIKTYLGIHLFGSVINLSSLILVADKLSKRSPLTNLQVILLTRAFSSDAYWSPFFVAFAAALTYVPNLSASFIFVNGIGLAIIAFLFTYFEIIKNYDLKQFEGYPIHFETLYIPVLLAISVLSVNHYFPQIKVIILISLFSIILTLLILPIKNGLKSSAKKFTNHISQELPKMKNELSLFLVAGAFGVAISSVLSGFNIQFPFSDFDAISASILLLLFIILSFIGIHPIISIAVIGNWMGEVNHTLFAMAFLMSWATAVCTSPFSGLNLTMQARYDVKAIEIFKVNIPYALKMYVVCVIILFIVSNYLGL